MKRQIAMAILFLVSAVSNRADRLDDLVRGQMKQQQIPGVVVVVLQNGVIVEQRAYGLANIEFDVPMKVEDVFPISWVTEVFTATATFELVQDGRIRLEDRVSSVVAGLPATWNGITILQCLNHTSGLPSLYDNGHAPIAFDPAEAIRKLAEKPLAFQPGEKTRYSETELLLLRMVIEMVSGKTFADFLAERIFQPLGMKTAQFADARDIIPRKVSLYSRLSPDASRREFLMRSGSNVYPLSDQQKWVVPLFYPESVKAAAGLVISAPDLAKFDAALSAKTLLNAQTVKRMWEPTTLSDGAVGAFTAGWQRWEQSSVFVGHASWSGVEYVRSTDGQCSVIVFTDTPGAYIRALTMGILQMYGGSFFPQLRDLPGT